MNKENKQQLNRYIADLFKKQQDKINEEKTKING